MGLVNEAIRVQGRWLNAAQLQELRELIAAHPHWSRRRISEALCRQWDWRNGASRFKDMAARTLLLKLHQRGLIELPARRSVPTNRMRAQLIARGDWDQSPIQDRLAELGTLRVREVSSDRTARAELASALAQFHYLGHGGTVGENLQYQVRDGCGRLLACLLFGAPAWKCGERDRSIGWTAAQREQHLYLVTNNTRFLILPWIRVPHLAGRALSQVLRRLSADWQTKYGHPIVLVETFVETSRFAGTVYRAANWRRVGSTTGRSRQDTHRTLPRKPKDVYLYPLRADFREVLCV